MQYKLVYWPNRGHEHMKNMLTSSKTHTEETRKKNWKQFLHSDPIHTIDKVSLGLSTQICTDP